MMPPWQMFAKLCISSIGSEARASVPTPRSCLRCQEHPGGAALTFYSEKESLLSPVSSFQVKLWGKVTNLSCFPGFKLKVSNPLCPEQPGDTGRPSSPGKPAEGWAYMLTALRHVSMDTKHPGSSETGRVMFHFYGMLVIP